MMDRVKEFYELYKETIYRYFLRMTGSKEEATELTQETFFQACLSIHRYRAEASPKTWLYAIARHIQYKKLRERTKHPTISWDDANFSQALQQDSQDNPANYVLQAERRGKIKEALALLPETARSVIVLKEYEGLSYEEIAQIYQQTSNWARVTYFRGKQLLGRHYKDLGGDEL